MPPDLLPVIDTPLCPFCHLMLKATQEDDDPSNNQVDSETKESEEEKKDKIQKPKDEIKAKQREKVEKVKDKSQTIDQDQSSKKRKEKEEHINEEPAFWMPPAEGDDDAEEGSEPASGKQLRAGTHLCFAVM